MISEEKVYVLTVNPGSTSTKIGIFKRGKDAVENAITESISHSDEELAYFSGIISQLQFRTEKILDSLKKHHIAASSLAAVVGRGGLLKPLASGTYAVNDHMISDLQSESRGSHASNLGGLIAKSIADEANCNAYIVDPVSVDELEPVARISGCKLFERTSLSHALNTKAVAKRFAAASGKAYKDLRLLIVHLGSGVSVSSHVGGKMIDVNNSREEGPFAPDRSGTVPAMALLDLCFSGKYDKKELANLLFKKGGVASYLDTIDMRKAVEMIEAGNKEAKLVIDALIYQVCKEVGANAAVLEGKMDGLIITGGIAQNPYVMAPLMKKLEWLHEVTVYPGEDELQALYEGVERVLSKEEEPLTY